MLVPKLIECVLASCELGKASMHMQGGGLVYKAHCMCKSIRHQSQEQQTPQRTI